MNLHELADVCVGVCVEGGGGVCGSIEKNPSLRGRRITLKHELQTSLINLGKTS